MYAGAGEKISVYNDPQIIDVGTGSATIPLPMGYALERFFYLDPLIAANKIFQLTQDARARKVKIKFSANAGVILTLWADTIMSNVQFNLATLEYTVTDTGAFTLESWWDGVNWNTTIIGPDNV